MVPMIDTIGAEARAYLWFRVWCVFVYMFMIFCVFLSLYFTNLSSSAIIYIYHKTNCKVEFCLVRLSWQPCTASDNFSLWDDGYHGNPVINVMDATVFKCPHYLCVMVSYTVNVMFMDKYNPPCLGLLCKNDRDKSYDLSFLAQSQQFEIKYNLMKTKLCKASGYSPLQ